MTDREAHLLAAAQAFIAITRGGLLEQNMFWTAWARSPDGQQAFRDLTEGR